MSKDIAGRGERERELRLRGGNVSVGSKESNVTLYVFMLLVYCGAKTRVIHSFTKLSPAIARYLHEQVFRCTYIKLKRKRKKIYKE